MSAALSAIGAAISTIKGLTNGETFDQNNTALTDVAAFQCGFYALGSLR